MTSREEKGPGVATVLAVNSGHDGAAVVVQDGQLLFSFESEKDSNARYGSVTAAVLMQALESIPTAPDLVAVGGYHKHLPGFESVEGGGYFGVEPGRVRDGRLFGHPTRWYTSTHERSNVFAAAALAPGAPVKEAVILVYEGTIGAFYEWHDYGQTIRRHAVMSAPGARYAAVFAVADAAFPDGGRYPRAEDAGKLMALAGATAGALCPPDVAAQVDRLLTVEPFYPLEKAALRDGPLYNAGVESPVGRAAARYVTDAIFQRFHAAARPLAGEVPLLIAGGCGLNCDWNVRWIESGLFSDVFIPPCANDSGSAIGTAADGLVALGSPPALSWSVFSGPEFVADVQPDPAHWRRCHLDHGALARALADGRIVAWVQGRAEIGPRALGHRSLLASASNANSRLRLNTIKGREGFRPVAPCCLAEDTLALFDLPRPSRHMLLFGTVRSRDLPGITHEDGTARPQSVYPDDNPELYTLLHAVKACSGQGVLCNTSLNYSGRGFLNRSSELLAYCDRSGIRDVVIGNQWLKRVD